jgi:hypothetical protein
MSRMYGWRTFFCEPLNQIPAGIPDIVKLAT